MFNPENYPILGPIMNVRPGELFRLEDISMEHTNGTHKGSAIFMFTGIYATNKETRTDHIYCVPIHFYGNNAKNLAKLYQGRNVWVQLTEIMHEEFPEGYLN